MLSDLIETELDVSNVMDVRSLSVYGNYLYWVDTKSGKLSRVDKMTGEGEELVLAGMTEPTDVLVVDKSSLDGRFNLCCQTI